MKAFLLLSVLASMSLLSSAQNTASLQVLRFEAEGNHYYQAKGCIPQSEVAFYSERSGGKLLKTITADANGTAIAQMPPKQQAAFALSTNSESKAGVKGTGKVAFYGDPLFSIQDITVKNINGAAFINWRSSATNDKMVFRVLRSNDGIAFTPLTSLRFNQSANLLPYTCSDPGLKDLAFYKIEVSNIGGVIYTTSVRSVSNGNSVRIYPTAANGMLNVLIASDEKGASYKLISAAGKEVQSGILADERNSISLEALASGNYLIVTGNGDTKRTAKFVKL